MESQDHIKITIVKPIESIGLSHCLGIDTFSVTKIIEALPYGIGNYTAFIYNASGEIAVTCINNNNICDHRIRIEKEQLDKVSSAIGRLDLPQITYIMITKKTPPSHEDIREDESFVYFCSNNGGSYITHSVDIVDVVY